MTPQQRIRLARRHAGMSQAQLANAVGVQRSAVSHWEAVPGKSPSTNHLRAVAVATGVPFEWLATGRGKLALDSTEGLAAGALAPLVDALEQRLLIAFRGTPLQARAPLVELAEQLARTRSGRPRRNDGAPDPGR